MIRKFVIFAAAATAVAFSCQSADAHWRHHRHHRPDARLAAVSIGVGAASTAAYFGINDWRWKWHNNGSGLTSLAAWGATTVGCIAVAPIVATVVLDRPLTQREAGVLAGSCIVPIIGGWLVNAAYDAHPEWDPASAPVKKHWTKKK